MYMDDVYGLAMLFCFSMSKFQNHEGLFGLAREMVKADQNPKNLLTNRNVES